MNKEMKGYLAISLTTMVGLIGILLQNWPMAALCIVGLTVMSMMYCMFYSGVVEMNARLSMMKGVVVNGKKRKSVKKVSRRKS